MVPVRMKKRFGFNIALVALLFFGTHGAFAQSAYDDNQIRHQQICQQLGAAAMMAPSHTGGISEGIANQQKAYADCMAGISPQPQQQATIAIVPSQTCRVIGGNMIQCY